MAGLTGTLAVARPRRLELQGVLCTLVLAAVGLCVVFPLLLVALQSLQVAPPGQPASLTPSATPRLAKLGPGRSWERVRSWMNSWLLSHGRLITTAS